MKLIIVGTDHTSQDFCTSFGDLIAQIAESERVTLIAEEYPFASISAARRMAQSKGIAWVQIDMNTEERVKAGIYEKLCNRMQIRAYDERGMPLLALRYAPNEDGVREEFWLDRIAEHQIEATILVICGAVHARPLANKAEQRGHDTSLRFFPEIPGSQFWLSITPELF